MLLEGEVDLRWGFLGAGCQGCASLLTNMCRAQWVAPALERAAFEQCSRWQPSRFLARRIPVPVPVPVLLHHRLCHPVFLLPEQYHHHALPFEE